MSKYNAIILAGGMGKRMNSNKPKVLQEILDKNLINYVLDACKNAKIADICVVVGKSADLVKENLANANVQFAMQETQLGTGHAVMCAKDYIKDDENYIILYGDMPLITEKTITHLINFFEEEKVDSAILTGVLENATGYGRIIRDANDYFKEIIEEKDANKEIKKIKEGNLGLYIYKGSALKYGLSKLTNNNAQKEYYLTDTITHIKDNNMKVGLCKTIDLDEIINVNSKVELAEASNLLLNKICRKHMENGVNILRYETSAIGKDVEIEKDVTILPGCVLEGKTKIKMGCVIGPNTHIINSTIGENTTVEFSKITDSKIHANCKIGPFAHIRPNVNIDEDSKVGAFVEMKNSNIGKNTKASHLLYVGDSEVGNNVEFGCGVMTVNCDVNFKKHKTVIKDNVFIGCNSALLAPVTLEENSIIAAGSTITENVEKNSLAIARERQVNKLNYKK